MLAILDYKAGNQTSVRRALEHMGIPCCVTDDTATLESAQGIIFPGVGAAGQAMSLLNTSGLGEVLRRHVQQGKPLLGICLGCQILLDSSEENNTPGLGLIPGICRRFPPDMRQEDGSLAAIPHMGWNGLHIHQPSRLVRHVPEGAEFYFVHSYYVEPAPELIIATTHYGMEFCSLYGRDGLWAAQFHLEKSGQAGLTVLKNFYEYCQEAGNAA